MVSEPQENFCKQIITSFQHLFIQIMGDSDTSDVTKPNNTLTQQLQQLALTSSNNTKFPYLKKDEYEIWAMKMPNWITNSDFNLWNVILTDNILKKTGKDQDGKITIYPPSTVEEVLVVQRENKARTILPQAIPDDHMSDFHYLDDAKDIWLEIKARFRGNEESKRMRKSMLRQEFQEFKISEEEGVHKGYDRFQKILSQLNQLKARPVNEECNSKFLRALPPSWSQVSISLKTKGGLDYLSFDDLYNKLRSLELDIKGHLTYSTTPTNSAFVTTTSNKMTHAPSSGSSSTISYTSPGPKSNPQSGNVIEEVLHSFVAEYDQHQQLAYEDFEQVDMLDMEEMDLKWQMAMLTLKVKRFEKKAGRKLNLRGRDPARFDRRKVKCYSCGETGHFSRECTAKKTEDNTRYSAYKQKELEAGNSKALVTAVDSCINWKEHYTKDTESNAS